MTYKNPSNKNNGCLHMHIIYIHIHVYMYTTGKKNAVYLNSLLLMIK